MVATSRSASRSSCTYCRTRLGRPFGPSHAIGFADPRHSAHSQGFGACEEDGANRNAGGKLHGIVRRPGRTFSQSVEECHSGLSPARVLVVATPAVRCDHRQYDPPELADQCLVRVWIALADLFGDPSKVEFYRAMDRILEVHEKRPVLRLDHVPRVRLAVQDLLGRAPVDNRFAQISQRVGEKRPIGLGEIGSDLTARNVLLSRRHASHEVRRRDVDLPQPA